MEKESMLSSLSSSLLSKHKENEKAKAVKVAPSPSSLVFNWPSCIERLYQNQGHCQLLHQAYRQSCHRIINQEMVDNNSNTNKEQEHQQKVVLITGPSGVGKTGLAMTLADQVKEDGGFFIRGKFDQPVNSTTTTISTSSTTTPVFIHQPNSLTPFVTAMNEFCHSVIQQQNNNNLLASDDDDGDDDESLITAIAESIRQELDVTEIQVLEESIPALQYITSPPRPPLHRRRSSLSSTASSLSTSRRMMVEHHQHHQQQHWQGLKGPEAEKRYMYLFSKLVRAISSPERPLVLLLDDIQWADAVAMQLFQLLMASHHNNINKGLLLIGISRCVDDDDAIKGEGGAVLAFQNMNGVAVTEISIKNMSETDIHELLSDLLQLTLEETESLSRMAHYQTGGNLFFLLQFLSVLQGKGLLYLNEETGKCTWNDDAIMEAYSEKETILDLLTKKILQLSPYEQELLQMASCLGGSIHRSLLDEIALPSSAVLPALQRIQDQGLVQFDVEHGSGCFTHDRIQEAAYLLIPEELRARKHLEIGLRLWIWLSPHDRDTHLFNIVNQIIRGLDLLDDPIEKEELAEFLLRAGEKAVQSSSFSAAAVYFAVGIRLLGRTRWKHQYKLSLALHNAAAEVEYYNGNHVRVDVLLAKIFKHAKSLDDKFRAYFTQIYSMGSRDDMRQALDKGLEVLYLLGEHLPRRPGKVQSELAWRQCQWMLRGKTDDMILNLPTMKDNRKLVVMRLLNTIWGFTIARDELGPLLLKRMIENTLRHGLCPMCCVGIAAAGYYLGRRGRIEEGSRFGRLGLLLLEKFQAREWHARVLPTVLGGGCYRRQHLKELIQPLQTAHRAGLVAGDVHFSMVCASLQCRVCFFSSHPLPVVVRRLEEYRNLCDQYDQQSVGVMLLHQLQLCLNFMGEALDPVTLTGKVMNEAAAINALQGKQPVSLAWILIMKHILAVYFNDLEEAKNIASKLAKMTAAVMFTGGVLTFIPHSHLFLEGLAAASLARTDPSQAKRARQILEKLKSDDHVTCRNFENKIALVEAELAASQGDRDLALSKYDESIHEAQRYEFHHEQALACERAGRALIEWRQFPKARDYLESARSLYNNWGGLAKVKQVDDILCCI